MAKNSQPVAKRCKALNVSPTAMGYGKKNTNRNPKGGLRRKPSEYALQLDKGDQLFLYTDGVPEANDAENNMFGMQRMLDALNQQPDVSPEELLHQVRDAVSGFVKDAEQFDDLTMLCIDYQGSQAESGASET